MCILIFPAVTFNRKQLVTVLDALYRRFRQIVFLSGRNGITKLPTDMCPAGLTHDIRQIVVSLIPIGHQAAFESLQEFHGIEFCSG